MSAERWSDASLHDLMHILAHADGVAMGLWIAVNVGADDDAWLEYAAALGAIAASAIDGMVRAEMRAAGINPDDVTLIPVPQFGDDPDPVVVDAGRIVTMSMEHDPPGILGVLGGARERDAVEELCGALAVVAGFALRAEAAGAAGGAL